MRRMRLLAAGGTVAILLAADNPVVARLTLALWRHRGRSLKVSPGSVRWCGRAGL